MRHKAGRNNTRRGRKRRPRRVVGPVVLMVAQGTTAKSWLINPSPNHSLQPPPVGRPCDNVPTISLAVPFDPASFLSSIEILFFVDLVGGSRGFLLVLSRYVPKSRTVQLPLSCVETAESAWIEYRRVSQNDQRWEEALWAGQDRGQKLKEQFSVSQELLEQKGRMVEQREVHPEGRGAHQGHRGAHQEQLESAL